MRKYQRISSFIWLFFTMITIAVAIRNYTHQGWHNSWWYFITALFSLCLFVVRFWQWKKADRNKTAAPPEN